MEYVAKENKLKDEKSQSVIVDKLGTAKLQKLLNGESVELSLTPSKSVLELVEPLVKIKNDKEK